MKHSHVLENVYARIDFLDLDSASGIFVKVGSIYMLGEGSKYVKTIKDFNVKNKNLVATIGASAIKTLTEESSVKKGGDDWDELDEMDFEELLNTEAPLEEYKPVNDEKKILSGDHFSDLVLYSTDKLSDIRDKIAIATNIHPYKQYVWIPHQQQTFNGDKHSLMSYWISSIRIIEGYPIDGHSAFDPIQTHLSVDAFADKSTIILQCISVDSIIKDKSKLQFLSRSDSESYELIHSNTIHRFFPMISLPIFNQYILNEKEVSSKFETCEFDLKETKYKINQRILLMNELNKQKQVLIDSSDQLTVVTTGMIVAASYGDIKRRVDTINIFRTINITKHNTIAMVDLYYYDNEKRSTRLRKLQSRDLFRLTKDDTFITFGGYTKKSLLQSKSIIFTLLTNSNYDLIRIIIDIYGSVFIISQPNQTNSFSKAAFLKLITPIVDSILSEINTYDTAFISHERYPLLGDPVRFQYRFPSSSSKLSFMFPMSYTKILNLLVDKLMPAGLLEPINFDKTRRNNYFTSFAITYGVSMDDNTGRRKSSIDIKNINEIAMIVLSNLDVDETNLYIDIIGRLISARKSSLIIKSSENAQLSVIDPILFRAKITSDGYSRICQKKFQPISTTKDNPKAVEYYNFTFDKPEYYTCPSKDAPHLGFIQGKHEKGYCLPCCRKKEQPDEQNVRLNCISNESTESLKDSTYKIDYPISEVPNHKVMNRRISMPAYICHILDIQGAVANGGILSSHGGIRDGINPDTKSYLQTATIIAAIEKSHLIPMYNSHREFILDVISTIKEPVNQIHIMKNPIITDRFTTPQSLIHAIEDHFIRNRILESNALLSAVEWNDLIIFLANCMGLNVLLLADERIKGKSIQLLNLHDIDVNKAVIILLRRTNIEWSVQNHNTRAVYLPITLSSFKVLKKSALVIQRFNISKSLSKIKRIAFGSVIKMRSKQFTVNRILQIVKNHKSYKLLEDMSEQKLAIIGVNRNCFITSISTSSTTLALKDINVAPTASLNDVLNFIADYNSYAIDETPDIDSALKSYKVYLQLNLNTNSKYEFINTSAFLLKINKFIIYESMVIGMIVNVVDINRVISTDMMFIKPCNKKIILSELKKKKVELNSLHSKLNLKSIISFPLTTNILIEGHNLSFDKSFTTWLVNPLKSSEVKKKVCKTNMFDKYNTGIYTSEIYNILARNVIQVWSEEKDASLVAFIIKQMKKAGSVPIPHTRIDTMISDIANSFNNYDPVIVRSVMVEIFDIINNIDKSVSDATDRIRNSSLFVGFELKNIHRLNKDQVKSKVIVYMKDLTIKSSSYPTFNHDVSIDDQLQNFYDKKSGKVIVHSNLYSDLVDMIVSDLCNPFRRDYIIKMPLVESSFTEMKAHLGELIYIQYLSKY